MTRITTIAPLLAVLALAACNTVAGAGRDLQQAGAALQGEAARVGQQPANPQPVAVPAQPAQPAPAQ